MTRRLRVFFASDTSANPTMALASQIWRRNLYEPLVDLGHEVVEFDYDLRETFRNLDPASDRQRQFIEANRPVVTAELLRQVRAAHEARPIDLFFSYFYDACIEPEAIDALRALGILTVNWYCNGSYQLHLVSEISPHYDWCLVPEKFRLDDYRALGARPIYCQEAANPSYYKPHDVTIAYDVGFVGQAYGERPGYVRRLVDAGIDVRVWGPNWRRHADPPEPVARRSVRETLSTLLNRAKRREARRRTRRPDVLLPADMLGEPLSDDEMIRSFSRARINLGFSSCGETHRTAERVVQVRLRDFEVPMSGGFYLVESVPELAEFFEIGREIVCYDGPDDLVDKVRYYLAHPEERTAIARAGRARCLRDHTWQGRLQSAFQTMGL